MPASKITPFGVQDWIPLILLVLLAVGFGIGAGLFLWRFYRSMDQGDELRVDYHWGGLGGGLGGWRISKPFGYLFAAFGLAGLLAVSVVGLQPEKAAEENAAEEEAAAEEKATDQKAAAQKAAEQSAAELKAAEQKAAEQKAAEQKAAEQKAVDSKTGK